jgi:tight adherence protein B
MPALLDSGWGLALLAFVAVALGVVCLSLVWEALRTYRQEKEISRQLRKLVARDTDDGQESSPPESVLRARQRDAGPDWLQAILRFVPRRQDLLNLLEQAESNWSMGVFVLLTFGLTAAVGLSVSVVSQGAVTPLVLGAIGGTLPYGYLRRRRTKRYQAFEEHFPEAIELLARSLRAGHAILTGLEVVAQESPSPVDREFRQVFEEQRFGLPMRESLLGLADRIDTVDVRMFVTAVMIQRESGGNLAEILDGLGELIRERFKFRRQLRVHTAQGRMTGYLLAALPVLVGLALFTINRDYMIVLFVEPGGRMLLMATVIFQIVGFLWIRRIVNIEF